MQELIQTTAAGLERAVNAALALDPEAEGHLRRLDGRVLAVELTGLGASLAVIPVAGRLTIAPAWDGEADATIHGAPFSLLRLGLGDQGTVRRGDVRISGRVEVAQSFQRFFDQLDIDWEEHASRLLGDATAHRLGGLARDLGHWAGRLFGNGLATTGEYLREERRWLPSAPAVAARREDIATLRDDVARMEARIRLLEDRGGAGT
ncbi:MAG: ubiquinone biosynthesis accessory factor UbiJ [Pseudomonadota bacterium]